MMLESIVDNWSRVHKIQSGNLSTILDFCITTSVSNTKKKNSKRALICFCHCIIWNILFFNLIFLYHYRVAAKVTHLTGAGGYFSGDPVFLASERGLLWRSPLQHQRSIHLLSQNLILFLDKATCLYHFMITGMCGFCPHLLKISFLNFLCLKFFFSLFFVTSFFK